MTVPALLLRSSAESTPSQRSKLSSSARYLNSLRDAMSKMEDWFDMSAAKKDVVEAKTETADDKKKAATKKKPDDVTKEKVDSGTGEVTTTQQQNKSSSAGSGNLDFAE